MYAGGCGKDDQLKIISAPLVPTTWDVEVASVRTAPGTAYRELRVEISGVSNNPVSLEVLTSIALTDPGREHPHI
jgi:hypothetical protein